MSDAIELPEVPVVPQDLRAANQAANQANAVTAITGLSGAGKSALADTAAEYCWEAFKKITLCYANDPGGFGTKRLALIRAGIMHVYDPRTHVNFFETMEHCTLGAWPEKIEDPERGYADPSVRLILPRRIAYDVYCPQGHLARRFEDAVTLASTLQTSGQKCQQCGVLVNYTNLQKTEQTILRHPMFKNVGLRIYDSMSAINDQGLILELPTMSAKGKLATGASGGSALGSANAFTQGTVTYGTGSEAQVGFMQNRTYGWLMNVRQLPEVVVPTIVTFGIEESKKDDESGGLQILGPRIAGKARTSAVPGWVGNLLYASLEPEDIPKGTASSPNMVFRLWLTTHVDPRDARKIPILAKHRGTPLGFDYLEDKFEADPVKRKANAWGACSLANFFRLLDAQVNENVEALLAKYPDAPGFNLGDGAATADVTIVDEVVGTVAPLGAAPGGAAAAGASTTTNGAVAAGATPSSPGAPRQVGRRRAAAPPVVPASVARPVTVSPPATPATTPAPVPTAAAAPTPSAAVAARAVEDKTPDAPATPQPSVVPYVAPTVDQTSTLEQQLKASLEQSEVKKAGTEGATTLPPPVVPAQATGVAAGVAPPAVAATVPASVDIPVAAPPQPAAPVATSLAPAVPAPPGTPRVLRRPRPPVAG